MRTPNTQCILCPKPLYRRPSELKKARYSACLDCRDKAKRLYPITDKQNEALKLGRVKGENHLIGIPKSIESNKKRSESHRVYWANHPEESKARGEKIRGENHYRWNGGITQLNQAIRGMAENRKWSIEVRERDKKCQLCGSIEDLESHHIIPVILIIEQHKIRSTDDARICKELWDITNGKAICRDCHCKLDGRRYED